MNNQRPTRLAIALTNFSSSQVWEGAFEHSRDSLLLTHQHKLLRIHFANLRGGLKRKYVMISIQD